MTDHAAAEHDEMIQSARRWGMIYGLAVNQYELALANAQTDLEHEAVRALGLVVATIQRAFSDRLRRLSAANLAAVAENLSTTPSVVALDLVPPPLRLAEAALPLKGAP